jgi:cytochrome P450
VAGRFGNDDSMFTTSHHELHKLRRGALSSVFSRRSIVKLQPVVREKVEIFCKSIAKFSQGGKVVDMKKAWSAFAGDVICQYSFGYSYDHSKSQDFGEGFHDAFMAVSEFGHITLEFP